jgi:hypothetical protein
VFARCIKSNFGAKVAQGKRPLPKLQTSFRLLQTIFRSKNMTHWKSNEYRIDFTIHTEEKYSFMATQNTIF